MTELRNDNRDGADVFPIDIVELSKLHVGFLQSLHQLGVTLQRPSAKSLKRYRNFWLPLVRANPSETLIPPADCAWLWHCHRLAPFRYVAFIKKEFGNDCQVVEASPPFCFQWLDNEVYGSGLEKTEEEMNAAAEHTRLLWNQMYPEERFYFESALEQLRTAEEKVDDRSLDLNGFDLLGSTDRQATFLWQVSGPRFTNDEFLKQGAIQYYKFLKLRKQATISDIVLVPTYQIDLMWHTHILSNLIGYFRDCKAIMGTTLNHDDSLNDRSDDGPLDRAFKDTKTLWKKNYDEDYFVKGGMYRGEPPKEYYRVSWLSRISNEEAQIPMGPFLHMIDVQGASSTNPNSGEVLENAAWTPLSGMAPDGSPAFVAMAEKSTEKGVNSNPFKENYVFGKKGSQVGYFHITTREAYMVLSQRINARLKQKKSDEALVSCCTLGLCRNSNWKKKMNDEIESLEIAKGIAVARAGANGPAGKVGIPEKYKNDRHFTNTHYTDGGAWLFPAVYYESAGGCGGGAMGAGNSSGGGCGASACGAAACGAAACGGAGGGAGCGGGGCGGGGCGG